MPTVFQQIDLGSSLLGAGSCKLSFQYGYAVSIDVNHSSPPGFDRGFQGSRTL